MFAGWQLEKLEAAVVRAERPVSLLLPTHGGERTQGDYPAGERVGPLPRRGPGREAVRVRDLQRDD